MVEQTVASLAVHWVVGSADPKAENSAVVLACLMVAD
jgi:hypothetical protein